MDNPFDLLKKLMGLKEDLDDTTVEKNWVQAGKISAEDSLRRRNLLADTVERKREYEMHQKKMAALKALNDAEAAEWWNHVYKAYGLPDGNYHILEDGRIFVEPKEKKSAPTA